MKWTRQRCQNTPARSSGIAFFSPGWSSETTNSTPCSAGRQSFQKLLPARAALAVGKLDRQHLAPALPVNADRDQHRVARNDAVLADALVAGVQDQIGERLLQLAFAECLQRGIEPLVVGADRRGRERVADQFIGHLFDLPRRDALHVHLRQCGNRALAER